MDGGCVLLVLRDDTNIYTGHKTVFLAGWRGTFQLVRARSQGGGGGSARARWSKPL